MKGLNTMLRPTNWLSLTPRGLTEWLPFSPNADQPLPRQLQINAFWSTDVLYWREAFRKTVDLTQGTLAFGGHYATMDTSTLRLVLVELPIYGDKYCPSSALPDFRAAP